MHGVGMSGVVRWMRGNWGSRVIALALALVVAAVLPRQLVGRNSATVLAGDLGSLAPLADNVAHEITSGVTTKSFSTGSARFDGEWAFGTHQMAILGLSQVLLAHSDRPDLADRWLPAIRKASEVILDAQTRTFATEAWGTDALAHLDDAQRGDAWLGYVALSLGLHRRVDPEFAFGAVHDLIVAALKRRIEASPTRLIETYPGETYPVDVAASVAAIGVHAQLTNDPTGKAFVSTWTAYLRDHYVDKRTGYLAQSVSGDQPGTPRGSGTSLAAYFLGFVDPPTSRALFEALRAEGARGVLGFATIREFPAGVHGTGDIDSGPVLFGASVSATGFTLSSAKRFGDASLFTSLYKTASLFGAAFPSGHGTGHAIGGPLGDAILLAMCSALPAEALA